MKYIQSFTTLIIFILTSTLISGQDNTLTGVAAGLNLDGDGLQNSFYGRSSGLNMISGDENSFFGYQSGYGTITTKGVSELADKNSFLGYQSGYTLSFGFENTFMGYHAGHDVAGGFSNSFFGAFAGANTTNSSNTFIGHSSGSQNVSGMDNTYVGRNSGQTATGSRNTFIGVGTALNLFSGDNNICIGAGAGPTMSYNASNRLYIDVSQSDTPLIEGRFDGGVLNPIVKINGEFEVVGPFNGASDINLKKDFEPINNNTILKKVASLNISEWEYKKFEGDRHIGPVAQDFYATFGLGKGETTIASVDADGIALASIQALYELLQEEKERNDALEQKVEDLIQLLKSKN